MAVQASEALVENRMMIVPISRMIAPTSCSKSLADEQADLLHIIGGADHQLAGLVLVVIREGQVLDLGVQVVAQVVGHGLRILLRPERLQEGRTDRAGRRR